MSYITDINTIRIELGAYGLDGIEEILANLPGSKSAKITLATGEDRNRVRFLIYCLLNIMDAKKFYRIKMDGPTSLILQSVHMDKRPSPATMEIIEDANAPKEGFIPPQASVQDLQKMLGGGVQDELDELDGVVIDHAAEEHL